ncbi:EAL domain-containing protein [Spirochaeta dissipatitropha]
MGIFYFDIAALIIHVLNLLLLVYRRYLYTSQVRIFFALILISMSAALIDVINISMFISGRNELLPTVFFLNSIFYLLQNSIAPVFLLFVLSISGRLFDFPKRTLTFLGIPWAFSMLLIMTNPFTHLVFHFDIYGQYVRGPGLNALYAVVLGYVIFGMAFLIYDRKRMDKDTLLSMSLFLPVTIIPTFIQYFFPELLIQNLGIALSELFILLTIFDFSAYIDRNSGLFNREGLITQLELLLRKRHSIHIFVIRIGSFDYRINLSKAIRGKLFTPLKANYFGATLGNRQFALTITDMNSVQLDAERTRLLHQLSATPQILAHSSSLSAHICELCIPKDTEDIQTIFQVQVALDQMSRSLPANRILELSDLSLEYSERRLEISRIIRSSLEKKQFEVYFQPIITTGSNSRISSAEALIRLHDNNLGWISPAEFIPIAEQDGSIHRIGDYVMNASCAFFSELRSAGYNLDCMDVNLSSLQCLQSNICERMLSIVRIHGLQPTDIQLEITETAAAQSPAVMKRNLASLSEAGFSIAIDDFGTGHSNLYTIMGIPFTVVKLDRSLIQGMHETIQGRVGLESIIAMFRKMDIPMIAEGVEQLDELQLLQQLGVEQIQGYYYSKPLPAGDFLRFIKSKGPSCT